MIVCACSKFKLSREGGNEVPVEWPNGLPETVCVVVVTVGAAEEDIPLAFFGSAFCLCLGRSFTAAFDLTGETVSSAFLPTVGDSKRN